jgi:hypothetical protein
MKKLLFTSLIMLSLAFVGFSQTIPPPFINYQAVLYDVNGANPNSPLTNQSFSTFVNINDELGNLLYREEHYASTDANGLITVKMGDGLYTAGPITNFNQINWGVGKYYLVVDFDINGTISSTAPEQLVTVPYSFYAGNAGNGMTSVADNGNGTLTFTYANGATYTTPTLAGIQGPAGPAGPSGASGTAGAAGQSAYDLWLGQGNTGTVQDFLSTSAYQIWLAQGNTGTAQDFLNTLVGPQGPQGPQGIQGATGPSGTDGAIGAQGPIGLTGATGPQGIQGPAGNDGSTGPQGPIGITGPAGPAGAQGSTGPDGRSAYEIALLNGFVGTETQWLLSLVGATGPAGATGAQGLQGPVGNDGSAGPQGPIGLTGATGPQGLQGPAGNDGSAGPQGPIGLTGATGPQGVQGPAGNDGSTGPQGPIGLTGAEGPQGIQGVAGVNGVNGTDGRSAYEIAVLNGFVGTETQWLLSLVGATGPAGATGAQGLQGPAGNDGSAGPQGPIGLTGATGPQGVQGPAGNDGSTGPQGPIGLTGATGPQGIQGPAGNDGATGPQGPIGSTGTNGQNSLVKSTNEIAGINCATGGVKLEYGLDVNSNGELDANEINNGLTKFVCNGAASSGSSGSISVLTQAEINLLNPAAGQMVYNTTSGFLNYFNGNNWVQINNGPCVPNPSTANAGTDISTLNQAIIPLAANTPANGTGTWSVVSGSGGSFSNVNSPQSTFTGLNNTTYILRWTIATPCSSTTDDVSVTFGTMSFSATGSYQIPAGVTSVKIELWGAGGGGGAAYAYWIPGPLGTQTQGYQSGSGGGAGGYGHFTINVVAGNIINFTVGNGGNAGVTGVQPLIGGSTSCQGFTSFGGNPGQNNSSSFNAIGGTAGTSNCPNVIITGNGQSCNSCGSGGTVGGAGYSAFGNGANGSGWTNGAAGAAGRLRITTVTP